MKRMRIVHKTEYHYNLPVTFEPGIWARFVTRYVQMGDGQHAATHAWTEVYIPGAGWHGFDPTDNKLAGSEQISVAVAREQENASPFSSAWSGSANAFNRMELSVEVVPVETPR